MKTQKLREAIEAVLAAMLKSEGPVLSEQLFLRELVGQFANTGALGKVLTSIPGLARHADSLEQVHQQFRNDLQAFLASQLTVGDRKRIHAAADRVLMVPRTGVGGAMLYHYLPDSPEAAVAHAMRLLLDPSKPQYGEDLKQCQWEECNRIEDARQLPHVPRFFFVSERREAAVAAGKKLTGKAPDRYCCEEHMRAAHRARATEATLRRRRELREQKLKAAAKRAATRK